MLIHLAVFRVRVMNNNQFGFLTIVQGVSFKTRPYLNAHFEGKKLGNIKLHKKIND